MRRGKKDKKTRGSGDPVPHLTLGLEALERSEAIYLLVGGIAMNLHGLSRATKDIDVLIPKDYENTKKLLKGLENLGFGIAREMEPEEVLSKPFTIIGDVPRVDLLLRAGKLRFEEAYPNRMTRVINGIRVSYVSLDDLIKSKQTGRLKDKIEIKAIQKIKNHNRAK